MSQYGNDPQRIARAMSGESFRARHKSPRRWPVIAVLLIAAAVAWAVTGDVQSALWVIWGFVVGFAVAEIRQANRRVIVE